MRIRRTSAAGISLNMVAAILVATATLALAAVAAGAEPGSAGRPNILWITAEDMSPTLGCWGDDYAITPHIDRLARESVRYTNAFATAPVCSPVRSCLITGCYATTLGTQRLRSAFPIPTTFRGFSAQLRQAGYFCTNNVKTDYNTANADALIDASWDECSDTAHWRDRPARQPFFAVFNIMTSHQSRTMVWPYLEFQQKVQSRLTASQIHAPQLVPLPPYYPDTPVVRRTVARYYDCVTAMDQTVGRILKELHDDALDEETIVFFYSDHGSGMPRHKRALLDSGMHVPLLIRFPGKFDHLASAEPGESEDRLVSFVDFGPTVLSLSGIDRPSAMQGIPFLGRAAGPPRELIYGARDRVDECYDLARSVRDHRYLYIRNFMPHLSYNQPSGYPDEGEISSELYRAARKGRGKVTAAEWHYVSPTRPLEELYDVRADPQNLHNLAGLREYDDVLTQRRAALRQWILTTRDAGFVTEEQMWSRLDGATPYAIAKDPDRYPLEKILATASLVGTGRQSLGQLTQRLTDAEPAVRYWAAVGLVALGPDAAPASGPLRNALNDSSPSVRIEAAQALILTGATNLARHTLVDALKSPDENVVLHAARTVELLGDRADGAMAAMRAARHNAEGPGDLKMFIRFATDAFLLKDTAKPK